MRGGIRCPNSVDARIGETRLAGAMKTSNFRIVPLATEIAEAARHAVTSGASDHAVMTADSPRAYPCRHCLRWAQPGERVRRVAFLHPYPENDPEVVARVIAFRQGLGALGWTENRNIRISGGDLDRIQAYATELVRSAPDLIVGSGTPINRDWVRLP